MLSWCFSDFLTIDSGLQEVWVTMLSMSVFHWTRRVVSLPSQALRVSVHASLLLPGPDDGDASSAAPSGPSAASSAASSRRCLEAATSYCFLRTVAYLLGCFTFLCSRSVGVKTASLAKVGDGGITTQLGLPAASFCAALYLLSLLRSSARNLVWPRFSAGQLSQYP